MIAEIGDIAQAGFLKDRVLVRRERIAAPLGEPSDTTEIGRSRHHVPDFGFSGLFVDVDGDIYEAQPFGLGDEFWSVDNPSFSGSGDCKIAVTFEWLSISFLIRCRRYSDVLPNFPFPSLRSALISSVPI